VSNLLKEKLQENEIWGKPEAYFLIIAEDPTL
jgi:hypothetical protein